MGFDIMSLLNEESRKAAVDGYKVEMVDIERIEPSPDNFYNISEEKVLSMCASIDAVGIQQPLLVEEQGGRYQIIAGETRYQAMKRMAQEGDEKYRSVPCRVMREISQEDRKLLLILTNSTQRERTDYEKMLEISALRDALQPKKEQEGKGFKMQQSLSEITGMSKSAIGRLDNIRNHLCVDFLEAFKDGELNTSAADAIASLSQEQQDVALEKFRSSGKITSGEVRQMFSERPCTIPEEGELDAPSPEESEKEPRYTLATQKIQTGEPFDIVDNDDDAESAAELMQQFNIKPDATSFHGFEKTVRPEGSLLTTKGCGRKYDCFSCSMPCETRQEYRHCVNAPLGSPFPCDRMDENARKDMEAGMYGDTCQFLNLDLAERRAGDNEPIPCCRECGHKAVCYSCCERVQKEVRQDAAREKRLKEREVERNRLKAEAEKAAKDALKNAADKKKQSEAKQAELRSREDDFIREFYDSLYDSEKQIIKSRDRAEITKLFKKEHGSTYEGRHSPDGICWSCFPDKITFTISGMGEALQIVWGKFVTKLLHLLDDYPEIEAGETKAEATEQGKKPDPEAYELVNVKNLLWKYERNLAEALESGAPQPFTQNAKILTDALTLLVEKCEFDEKSGEE